MIHFIGIGGIGMSALARYFRSQKRAVSGSDAVESLITQSLKRDGVMVKIGHKRANVPAGAELVVISQAILPQNPELREARRRGARVLTYPEVIAELTEQYTTIAIAGAHGKSTTTALAALMLIKGGLDPTVIVGANLKEFGSGSRKDGGRDGGGGDDGGGKNFRSGRSSYFILEADEFGNAFLRYSPTIAIVTNIDREHLDVYKNLANVKRAFIKFLTNTEQCGTLILNRDDKNLYSLKSKIVTVAKKKGLKIVWYSIYNSAASKIKKVIKIPGVHNLSNATAVSALGKLLKMNEKLILSAIGSYRGASRRMQYRGTFHGAPVFDDYAHHPTEIKATIRAFREKYPKKHIFCVFQPHQAERLAALFTEFTTAFDEAHEMLILPTYKVAGRDRKSSKFDSRALAKTIQKQQPKKLLFYLPEPENLKEAILSLPTPLSSKVIVMMGAGDIVKYTDTLLS